MDQTLFYFPGQKVTIFLEPKDLDGYNVDSFTDPFISEIFAFTAADGYTLYDGYLQTDGYNQPFTKIAVGVYFAQITLPKTASAAGSYFVKAAFTNPVNGFPNFKTYQIVVNAPFGNFGTTKG